MLFLILTIILFILVMYTEPYIDTSYGRIILWYYFNGKRHYKIIK